MAALSPADTKAYLAKHNVERVVNEAVNSAVLANSPQPIAHVARFLARRAGLELAEPADGPAGGRDTLAPLGAAGSGGRLGSRPEARGELQLDELSAEEARLASLLLAAGQQHIFETWPGAGVDRPQKRAFFASILALDRSYPGGLRAYLENGKRLLRAAQLGHSPLDGWTPSPPDSSGAPLQLGTREYEALEELGMDAVRSVAFVIPAGGMGERLGYSGVKFGLPAEMTTEASVLEVYARYLLAFERLAEARRPDGGPVALQLALMVSHQTRPGIEALLAQHGHYGLRPDQLTLLQQEEVACFSGSDGRLAMRDAYTLETKPHGHGDVHFLLHASGLAQRWLSQGLTHVCFFQDTNTLYLATFLAALGASEQRGLDLNSVCVPRKAKEAVGAMAQLSHADGRSILASVEYNQLEPLLRSAGKGGDVNDPATGASPYPGNINLLLFRLPAYVAALNYTKGELQEFVNPKYAADEEGEPLPAFKTPARLECLMQDFASGLQTRLKGSKVGYTQVPAELGYYPVKNSLRAAAELCARGIPPMGAATAEAAVYRAHGALMRVLGCRLEQPVEAVYAGVRVDEGPRVVLTPAFAASVVQLRAKLLAPAEVAVSRRSTLVIDGANVTIRALNLDGALLIEVAPCASLHIESLEMHNEGWSFTALSQSELGSASVREVERIRGYRVRRGEELRIVLTEPGRWSVVNNQLVREPEAEAEGAARAR